MIKNDLINLAKIGKAISDQVMIVMVMIGWVMTEMDLMIKDSIGMVIVRLS